MPHALVPVGETRFTTPMRASAGRGRELLYERWDADGVLVEASGLSTLPSGQSSQVCDVVGDATQAFTKNEILGTGVVSALAATYISGFVMVEAALVNPVAGAVAA